MNDDIVDDIDTLPEDIFDNTLPDDIFDNFDCNTKCGEIFVTKGELNYICTFCSNIYINLQKFSQHLFQNHQLFNFEPIINNDTSTKSNNNNRNIGISETKKSAIVTTTILNNNYESSEFLNASINFDNLGFNLDNQILNNNQTFLQDNYIFNEEISNITGNTQDFLEIQNNIITSESSPKEKKSKNHPKKHITQLKKKSQPYQVFVAACSTTTNKPFRCEICNKKFATIKNLKNHRENCSKRAHEIPFKCRFCPRRFYDRAKCERHENIKHAGELNPDIPKGFWRCQICRKLLRSTCSRRKHEDGHFLLTDKNGKKTRCSCEICGKQLSSTASLKVHMRIHTEENRFKCAYCPARFKFSTSLKTHELSHTGERQFQCRYCDKRFLQNSHRKNHEILHNKEKKLECIHCRMKFHRMDYLNSHIKNKHSNAKNLENNRPYQCKYCNSSFTAEKYLKNHERLHINGVQYKCQYCDKTSIVKGIIERHEKTHLKTKETYPCQFCPKVFESKNGLVSHLKTKHPDNNILEFKCGKCEKSFENSSDLQEHIRKICSIAVKSFGCDKCSARFELEHGLKVHKAVTHIVEDSSFYQKGKLK